MATYDSATALVVVDVQNDFADPKGSLAVRGGEEIIPRLNDEVRQAREAGTLVVYSQDWHPESTPHFQSQGGPWPKHCVGGTWGAELHPALEVGPEAPRIRKGTGGEDGYSAFTVADPTSGEKQPTDLEPLLRERGIRRVVVGGLATDYCVKATALDARRLGFETLVLTGATAAVDLQPDDGQRALAEVAEAGARLE